MVLVAHLGWQSVAGTHGALDMYSSVDAAKSVPRGSERGERTKGEEHCDRMINDYHCEDYHEIASSLRGLAL